MAQTSRPACSSNQQQHSSAAHPSSRLVIFSLAKLVFFILANVPFLAAAPTKIPPFLGILEDEPLPAHSPRLWIYLTVAVGLVLLGGAFAGLTIALMGQDEIYLTVIEKSGEGAERKHAAKVLGLLKKGKHWVLVTLLLSNVITNETLPIVLDRSLGGGWPAVLGSTALIVIFGEIIPQSICVRYGLPIGSWMATPVLVLMWVMAPVAWPTAKLLDKLLGEDHGTVYKKAGLKTLVTLHKTLGAAGEQLNSDEVTIISAVLDLKAKPVGSIMTPMEDVFTMSADTVLDEKTMDVILGAGYSRIPIHAPENPQNFVGMLLVKILITYDPEDCKRVRDFSLATLPETRAETSCLDIVNFFQEGKSHMVLVSEYPGEDSGALGVVTLEDVIEELIGEEIIDESDVFIDVHKAIRRMTPAPKFRVPKGEIVAGTDKISDEDKEDLIDLDGAYETNNKPPSRTGAKEAQALPLSRAQSELAAQSRKNSDARRKSSFAGAFDHDGPPKRSNTLEMREHLKHLGPSNLASRPRQTRYTSVKIKPGGGPLAEYPQLQENPQTPGSTSTNIPHGGVGEGLVESAGKDAKDGVFALQASYGTTEAPQQGREPNGQTSAANGKPNASRSPPSCSSSNSTIASLRSHDNSKSKRFNHSNSIARSGSITENIIDTGGIKKTVLELTGSSSDEIDPALGACGSGSGPDARNGDRDSKRTNSSDDGDERKPDGTYDAPGGKKKRRRRKRKPGRSGGEDTPLLDRD